MLTFILRCFFFFSGRRRHTRRPRDWSSDVCSSDLAFGAASGLIDHHVDQARAQGLLSGDRGRGPAGESMAETVTDPREHILDAAEELAGADHEIGRAACRGRGAGSTLDRTVMEDDG